MPGMGHEGGKGKIVTFLMELDFLFQPPTLSMSEAFSQYLFIQVPPSSSIIYNKRPSFHVQSSGRGVGVVAGVKSALV